MKVKIKYKLEFFLDNWSNHDKIYLCVKFPKKILYERITLIRVSEQHFNTANGAIVHSYEEAQQMLTPNFVLDAIKSMVKDYYKDKKANMLLWDNRAGLEKQLKQFKGILEVDISES